ncbi:hypothetical protein AQUCO_01700116v1 [Aquilegia coerulea]|uniref:PUM-HD domain-containing protein n=1 Tax=Aquilegia coerulea TaxID=218851 RepID=A0A2G5DL82_AQUCA|nr:hypothetical protein AQUCO_01700116v1 [Aquilegia coerulea]
MAAKEQKKHSSTKRKQGSDSHKEGEKPFSKKAKFVEKSNVKSISNKPFNSSNKPYSIKDKSQKPIHFQEKNDPKSNRERRIQAKELAAARKKKRKPHYNLEQELASLWERMRHRNIAKEDRSKLVSEAIQKMMGKICEIAVSHVSSRVLQTCAKYCSQEERDIVFEELRPNLLTLACNAYAVHLVTKMLDSASKKQLDGFISSLHGHVAPLLRHMVGSVVIEHAYQLGNPFQKQSLLLELYSAELQLFKDLVTMKERRLSDLIPKLGLNKGSVIRHMASVIQPILEKGIVDHSIIHTALIEYLNIADKSSAAEILEQLSGPLLVRIIHTKDGSKLGMLCIKHGGAKERKKIIKGMKGHIEKIALDQYGCMVLVCMLSIVDDTKLLTKIVLRELQPILKELVFNKNGKRPLLQLLHPNCQRYLGPENLAALSLSVPSLCKGEGTEVAMDLEKDKNTSGVGESSDNDVKGDFEDNLPEDDNISAKDKLQLVSVGKKDPSTRRLELLVNSGLAEGLIDTCIENAEELLKSKFGKEVLYESHCVSCCLV